MTTALFADALGPRGRRKVWIASIVSGIGVAALGYMIFSRLADKGQLSWDRWEPLTQWLVIKFLLVGLLNTVKAAAVSMVLALIVGLVMALGRLAHNRPIRWLAGIFVELFRAIPLLILILFLSLGLSKYGFKLPPLWYLIFGLTLYNGAVLGEIFRAGILSLDRGQGEAATSLGLTYWQSMGLVIIPQAARRMVPAIVSQLVTLLKDTSLGFVIPYEELLRRGKITGEFYKNPLQALVVVAIIYIVVNYALTRFANFLERRQTHRYNAGPIAVKGVEDLAVLAGPKS